VASKTQTFATDASAGSGKPTHPARTPPGAHGFAHQATNLAAIVIPFAAFVLAAIMLWGRRVASSFLRLPAVGLFANRGVARGALVGSHGDLRYDRGGDVLDQADLVGCPDAWLVVDHAKRSDGVSLACN
jgi:hypothetical protein